MPIVQVNQTHFYYELQGQGKPVILIAGYTCDYSIWHFVRQRLSEYFLVLVFDNRAVGRTVDDGRALSAHLMAQDVMALARQLGLQHPAIVGQSMGGTIAQSIASQYPNDISKIALLTTSAKWRLAMLQAFQVLLFMREKNMDFDLIFANTLPWIFGQAFLENDQNIIALKKITLENPYPQSLKDQARQFAVLTEFNGIAQLKTIKQPCLIGYGNEDVISLPQESRFLADHLVASELVEFDCGHGIAIEAPQRLSDVLIEFLQA